MKEEEIEKGNLEEMGITFRLMPLLGSGKRNGRIKGERQGGICGMGLAFGFVGCSSVLGFR